MFLERLSRVAHRIDGAGALALVDADGIVIESVTSDELVDLEVLSAEILAHTRSLTQNLREFALGATHQVCIVTGVRSFLVGELAAGYYLLLVLRPGSVLGQARFELRRARLLFEGELA